MNRLSLISLLALTVIGIARGQEAEPSGAPTTLADRQQAVRDRVARLEDRMYQISQAIRQSEPEKAGRLLESLGASRGMAVRQKMEEIVKELRSEAYSDAAARQEAVLTDLQSLLKLMMEEPEHLTDRKKEIDRLQVIRERVDEIVKEQKKEKANAEASATKPEQAEAMRQAIEKTHDLIEREKRLADTTSKADANNASNAEEQGKLRVEVEALAQQMKAIPGKPSVEQLSAAAQRMQAAQDWLGKQQPQDAVESQQDAVEKLQEAIKSLQENLQKLDDKKPLAEQAAEQQATAQKTGGLSNDMKPEGAKTEQSDSKTGDPKQGDSKKQDDAGKKDDSAQPQGAGDKKKEADPGPKPEEVEKAAKLQEQAADKLKESNPDEAVKKQEQALKNLEKMQEDLKQTLEQLRKEQQEEMLAALEARFRSMLARQIDVSKATGRLADLGKDRWKRSDQLEVGELAPKQKEIGDEADKTLYILTEEGTTVAFPQIVKQIRDDAHAVSSQLAAAQADAQVRAVQDGIEQALRELIEAVKKKQEENQNGENNENAGGQDSPQPLLPGSAELKLLRSCQVRVNRATQALYSVRDKKKGEGAATLARLQDLAKRQEEIAKMAKEMHEAMTKAQ